MKANFYHNFRKSVSEIEPSNHQLKQFLLPLYEIENKMDQELLSTLHFALNQIKDIQADHVMMCCNILIMAKLNTPTSLSKKQNEKIKDALNKRMVDFIQDILLAQSQHKINQLLQKNKSKNIEISNLNDIDSLLNTLWDEIMHFSNNKTFLHSFLLYYLIQEHLFSPEKQLEKLLSLALFTSYKETSFPEEMLDMAIFLIFLIKEYLKNLQSAQINYPHSDLEIINLIYLSKKKYNVKMQEQIESALGQIQRHFYKIIENFSKDEIEKDNSIFIEENFVLSLLDIILIYNHNSSIRNTATTILENLIKYDMSLETVKWLIKKLEITEIVTAPSLHWKNIFHLMKICLNHYTYNRETIIFAKNHRAFIKRNIEEDLPFQIYLEFKSQPAPSMEEKLLLELHSETVATELWVTVRHHKEGYAMVGFVKVQKGIIWQKQQKQVEWKQFERNNIQIAVNHDKISGIINRDSQQMVQIPNYLKQITSIWLGDEENKLGTGSIFRTIEAFSIVKISANKQDPQNNQKMNLFAESNYRAKFVKKKIVKSFIECVRVLGDLDIFLLIVSHTLKKIKDDEEIIIMIRSVLELMEYVVKNNKTFLKELNEKEKSDRINSVLCLCWQASHENKSSIIVIELLRFLNIRGIKDHEAELQILCNFVFWKQFPIEYQKIILLKIEQIFKEGHSKKKVHKDAFTIKYCKRMVFEMVMLYKEEEVSSLAKKDEVMKLHEQFLSLVLNQIKAIICQEENQHVIVKLLQFLLNLLACTLHRSAIQQIMFDMTFAVEISFLLKDISEYFFHQVKKKHIKVKQHHWEIFELNDESLNKTDIYILRKAILHFLNISIEIVNLYEKEGLILDEESIKIYREDAEANKKFYVFNEEQIKTNLYLFNYYMILLDDGLMEELFFIENKPGLPEILSIFWEKQFFNKLTKLKIETIKSQLKYFINNTPFLKTLKEDKLTVLLKVYLTQLSIFPSKNIKFASELCADFRVNTFMAIINEVIESEQILSCCKAQEIYKFKGSGQGSKISKTASTINSEITDFNKKESTLVVQQSEAILGIENANSKETCLEKILNLLACHKRVVYSDCAQFIASLQKLKSIAPIVLLCNHLILKEFIHEIQVMSQTNLAASSLLQKISIIGSAEESILTEKIDLTEFENSDTQSELTQSITSMHQKPPQPSKIMELGQIVNCLEFYLHKINRYDVMAFMEITSKEQGQCHTENFKINIRQILNQVCSCKEDKIRQLKNFIHFLEKQLLVFSQFHLAQYKIIDFHQNHQIENMKKRKKSFHFEVTFQALDIKKEAQKFFTNFTLERNKNLILIEKVWSQVEMKNKYFWNSFISKERHYSLSNITGKLGEKFLLKVDNKKPKLELPKMKNNQSIHTFSIQSERHEKESESESSIFDDAQPYRKDMCFDEEDDSCLPKVIPKMNLRYSTFKKDQFKVLLIQNDRITQGLIKAHKKMIVFESSPKIDVDFYDKIYANQCERRTQEEALKESISFQVFDDEGIQIIVKRYLFHDIAIQIYWNNRSYFICFKNVLQRKTFLQSCNKKHVLNRESLKSEVKSCSSRWEKGVMSNFQYVMRINQLAGRSFNDLSQYYIFPWTVINFTDQIDLQFIRNTKNFRNLAHPVGKMTPQKFESIKQRYDLNKHSIKASTPGLEPFLYGSFYSNPAIVCNYLIRVNPFTSLHFELQSKQFDLADRLFFSVVDQFKSCSTNSSDFKELIPEFYYFPQFLKNRSLFNLGCRQNKDLVNDVTLPSWAEDQSEFVFKMKKLFQTEHVTKSLHLWIDLIFGKFAKKQEAIKADNLFLPNLYEGSLDEIKKSSESEESQMVMYKQFGQVPVPIFAESHPPSKIQENFEDSFAITQKEAVKAVFQIKETSHVGKLINLFNYKQFKVLLFEKQLRIYEEDKFETKDFIALNCDSEFIQAQFYELVDSEEKTHLFIVFQKRKSKDLFITEVKRNMWKTKYCLEDAVVLSFGHQCDSFTIFKKYLIINEGSNLHFYRNSFQKTNFRNENMTAMTIDLYKCRFMFEIFPQFTQHKVKITHISICDSLSMLISLDSYNKVYLLHLSGFDIEVYHNYELKQLYFEEKIIEMLVHDMSLILMRTDYDRLLITNFMGDKISVKNLQMKNTSSKVDSKSTKEKIVSMEIWNQELAELLIGTNLGNIWKVDLYEIKNADWLQEKQLWIEKIILLKEENFMKNSIQKMKIQRIGRHWSLLVAGNNMKVYILKSKRFDEIKKWTQKKNSFW